MPRLVLQLRIGSIALVALSAGASLTVVRRGWAAHLDRVLEGELEREARVVAAALDERDDAPQVTVRRLGPMLRHRVSVIGTDGTVLGDSHFDGASLRLMDNEAGRPEVVGALQTGVGTARRRTAGVGVQVAVAVRAAPGVVRITADVPKPDPGTIALPMLVLVVTLAVGSVWGADRVSRRVTRPLEAVRRVAQDPDVEMVTGPSGVPEVQVVVRAVRRLQEEYRTRLAALRREREEDRAVVDAMIEGVLAADGRGVVLQCNPAMRAMLDLSAGQALPPLRELFHQAEARDVVLTAMGGGIVPGRQVDLHDRTVVMAARPLPDGGTVLTMLDISDVKRLEMVRRDFVANVSHELKTPLTSILGYAETLLDDEPAPDTRRRFLQVIRDNARRMQRLVDDLLDLARIESRAWYLDRVPVAIAAAAREAVAVLGDRARERGIDLVVTIPEPLRVVADPGAIQQILANLLDNAVRHSPRGGSVTVSGRETDEAVSFAVSDPGPGIPAEHLPRIFERFYRVDPGRSREEGGTGLGLAIVRHLVEAHHGRIEVESRPGAGTTVRVTLPARPPGLDVSSGSAGA